MNYLDKDDKDLDGDDVEGQRDDEDGEDALIRLITWKTMVQLGTQLWSKMILMMEMMVRLVTVLRVRVLKRMVTWKTMVQLGTQLWSKTLASR